MAQVAHADIGSTPVDLTDGLEPGSYLAQVPYGGVIRYATGEQPPGADDWFDARSGDYFAFTVGPGCAPTWALLGSGYAEGTTLPVPLARR